MSNEQKIEKLEKEVEDLQKKINDLERQLMRQHLDAIFLAQIKIAVKEAIREALIK